MRLSQPDLAKLALVAQETDSMVLITDAHRHIEWVNQAFTTFTGYDLEDCVGKRPSFLQGKATDPKTVGRMREKLARKEAFTEDLINYTKDGRPYWTRLHVSPVLDDQRNLQGFVAIQRDISEEKDSVEQLRTSESRFRAIFESATGYNFFLDRQHRIVLFNTKAKEAAQSQYEHELYAGKDILELIPTEQGQQNFLTSFNRCLLGERVDIEMETETSVDKLEWLHVIYTPVRDHQGKVIGVNYNMENITQQRRAVLDFQRQQASLALSESRFRAIFESKNDCSIFLDTDCRVRLFNEQAKKLIVTLYNTELIEGQDFIELLAAPDRHHFIAQFGAALRGEYVASEQAFRLPSGTTAWYAIERTPIYQHGDTPTIIGVYYRYTDISATKEAERQLQAQNEQLREFAFLTSHRLRAPLANILGLTQLFQMPDITPDDIKDIVQRLQGAAEVLDQVVREMSTSISPSPYQSKWQNTKLQGKSGSIDHIWLVDDDPISNMVSKRLLERVNPKCKINQFLSAYDALDYLGHGPRDTPDLILLDIIMPGMDGWGFLDQFEPQRLGIPVAMLTSSVDSNDLARAKSYPSVVDFIPKPLNEDKLKYFFDKSVERPF